MDAFEIIRKTMNEFAEVSDDTIQAFRATNQQKEVQKVVSAGFGIFSGT